ncbi:MAG: hypothetical protein ACLUOI_40845 [Eisenbergiella sp.]
MKKVATLTMAAVMAVSAAAAVAGLKNRFPDETKARRRSQQKQRGEGRGKHRRR